MESPLHTGWAYLLGRDYDYKPVVILDLKKAFTVVRVQDDPTNSIDYQVMITNYVIENM